MNPAVQDENQAMLAESARKYGERGYGAAVRAASLADVHGCSPLRWGEFAEMGWLALPLPELDGGLGGSLEDMCVLAEELGRVLVVEPWIASAVLAAPLLAATGNAEQRARWLPGLGGGERRIAFAAWEPGCRFKMSLTRTRAERVADGYRLSGAKELICGAPGADALIVGAMCEREAGGLEAALFLIDPAAQGLELRSYALADGRHAAHLDLKGLLVSAQGRLNAALDVTRTIAVAMDRAVLVQCAETTGVMARALEMTLDYLKTRKQFGRVLASNQALQHRLVDLHVAIEETRALVFAAAQAFDGPQLQRQGFVAAAKAYASQAARLVWEETVQMHGAIGTTVEYQLGRYARHLAVSSTLFGDAQMHLEHLAEVEDRLHAHA